LGIVQQACSVVLAAPQEAALNVEQLAQRLDAIQSSLTRSHPPEVMTTEEAAAFLGMTAETLFRWRKDATGPKYSRINDRVIRYLKDDLLSWMRENQ
jgi:predicted DNA-binding transcriptional regulator AlpA